MAQAIALPTRPHYRSTTTLSIYGAKIGAIGIAIYNVRRGTRTGKQVSATRVLARLPRSWRLAGQRS